eukprot:180785_1
MCKNGRVEWIDCNVNKDTIRAHVIGYHEEYLTAIRFKDGIISDSSVFASTRDIIQSSCECSSNSDTRCSHIGASLMWDYVKTNEYTPYEYDVCFSISVFQYVRTK